MNRPVQWVEKTGMGDPFWEAQVKHVPARVRERSDGTWEAWACLYHPEVFGLVAGPTSHVQCQDREYAERVALFLARQLAGWVRAKPHLPVFVDPDPELAARYRQPKGGDS